MKKTTLLLLTALCIALGTDAATGKYRQKLTFDRDWYFRLCKDLEEVKHVLNSLDVQDVRLGDTGKKAEKTKVTHDTEPEQAQVTASEVTQATAKAGVGDGVFRTVSVPHDWSIELPFDPQMGGSAGYLAGGQGVYYKDFVLPSSVRKFGRIDVVFDGVYHRATVWINGHRLGHHVYGYTGFSFDISPYLNIKGKNRIVVHVDREEQSRWYTGSGIYRHVWIMARGNEHIKENGVFVQAKGDGSVFVKAEMDGTLERPGAFSFSHTIYDGEKAVGAFTGESFVLKGAKTWSTESPAM